MTILRVTANLLIIRRPRVAAEHYSIASNMSAHALFADSDFDHTTSSGLLDTPAPGPSCRLSRDAARPWPVTRSRWLPRHLPPFLIVLEMLQPLALATPVLTSSANSATWSAHQFSGRAFFSDPPSTCPARDRASRNRDRRPGRRHSRGRALVKRSDPMLESRQRAQLVGAALHVGVAGLPVWFSPLAFAASGAVTNSPVALRSTTNCAFLWIATCRARSMTRPCPAKSPPGVVNHAASVRRRHRSPAQHRLCSSTASRMACSLSMSRDWDCISEGCIELGASATTSQPIASITCGLMPPPAVPQSTQTLILSLQLRSFGKSASCAPEFSWN